MNEQQAQSMRDNLDAMERAIFWDSLGDLIGIAALIVAFIVMF